MQAGQWLLLTDYASKYRISVSTLRRRIKGGQIEFRFESGKYFIHDLPPSAADLANEYQNLTFPGIRPAAAGSSSGNSISNSQSGYTPGVQVAAAASRPAVSTVQRSRPAPLGLVSNLIQHEALQEFGASNNIESDISVTSTEEPLISSATRLLNELKTAYTNILHEKEAQIIHLKKELSDLRTLVRALEEDNDRLRKVYFPNSN